jgi:hypothetical protein
MFLEAIIQKGREFCRNLEDKVRLNGGRPRKVMGSCCRPPTKTERYTQSI